MRIAKAVEKEKKRKIKNVFANLSRSKSNFVSDVCLLLKFTILRAK